MMALMVCKRFSAWSRTINAGFSNCKPWYTSHAYHTLWKLCRHGEKHKEEEDLFTVLGLVVFGLSAYLWMMEYRGRLQGRTCPTLIG